jgi:hypothetical protein
METEKVYDLAEDGTITLEDGRIFAPIDYFMHLFGVSTVPIARRRIEQYFTPMVSTQT